MGRDILDIVFCIVVVALGLKAFTSGGIALSPGWIVQGRRARLAGAFALFVAVAFLFDRLSTRIWVSSNPDTFEISREGLHGARSAKLGVVQVPWDRAFCRSGNFSIRMPREHELRPIEPRPDIGNVGGYELIHDGPYYTLVASCYTFADEEDHPALVFDNYRDDMVTQFGWKLQKETDKTVERCPACAFVFGGENGAVQRSMLISKEKNLYQVIAEWESGSPVDKTIDDYLESFRFEESGTVERGPTTASP